MVQLRYLLLSLLFASIAIAQPTVRAVGTVASAATAVSPGLPTGTVAGDLLLMFCETRGEEAITATGWTQLVQNNDGSLTLGSRITVLYRLSTDGADATTTSDSGNHQTCRIIGITAQTFRVEDLFTAASSNDESTPNTSVAISGASSEFNNSLCVSGNGQNIVDGVSTTEYSSWANADWASADERIDNCGSAGDGGCMGVVTGVDTVAGAYGTTTATSVTDPDLRPDITFCVNPSWGFHNLPSLGVGP